ncbi:carbon monoxide dehydrogenase [Sphingomonas koreensis]|nr:carbon monoxide dehydrogenase [Sphingomonas koreensis]
MEMAGERLIGAQRERVWEALNDTAVLKASIPGCESIERLSATEMTAVAKVKIGPMVARFTGRVTLSDLDPPAGYTISGEGQGGAAGFAKGGARVSLVSEGEATLLSYTVQAQVGGKMAQFGARLIDATAKSLAERFFTNFADLIAAPSAPAEQAPAEQARPEKPAASGIMRLFREIMRLFRGKNADAVTKAE